METLPLTGFCNTYIFLKLRVYVSKSWLLDEYGMLNKQTVDMFPWQPTKILNFSISPIILKKTSFIMFINRPKKY